MLFRSRAGGAVWFEGGAVANFALMTGNRFVGNRARKAGGAVAYLAETNGDVTRTVLRKAASRNRFSTNLAPLGADFSPFAGAGVD